ncbi:competence protein ComEC family protein [Acidocella sp. MX-AZ03]|uniref:ComEC/Rec2 family competence protein n=1 Tax=Acidocella sp. MX-AZ03 TaxID=2697363 RepID=UPI0022DE1015|nr:ComEC/Rec2 family competence protein [Acidocella sp. MX-AZ03]WBO60198.1 competence protein ComEC family protein [Acidocella sp. MX-AZ03]
MVLARDWFARWVEAERGHFILLLPVAMGAAILVYFALPSEPPLWLAAALPVGALLALGASWRFPYARFLAWLLLAGAIGFARAEYRSATMPPMPPIPSGVVSVSGFVARVEMLPNTARVVLRAPRIDHGPTLRRLVRLKLRPGDAPPDPGALVKAYALLFGPDPPAYPGGWQQGRDEYFANLAAVGVALTPLKQLRPAPPSQWRDALQALRLEIATQILRALPLSTGAIAVTLLTGDEQIIPADERQGFILSGLAHILAVAGLHVGIVMGIVFVLARWGLSRSAWMALHWPGKPIAAVLALAGGAGYAVLTGAHLPILRSLAMASLVTLGVLLGRRAVSLRGLALAAMILLLATPEAILSASFQMSFSAVAALIAGYEAVHPIWRRFHAGRSMLGAGLMHVAELAFTSLLAGGASMPFSAYQFQQIEPYWIPANLVAVPLTALWIMPWGLAGLALLKLHLAWLAFKPMGWGIAIIVWMTAHIATWPDALLKVAPMPGAAILLIAAGLAWLCLWRSAARLAGAGLIAAGLVAALLARPPDVLVSADARLIGIRQGGQVLLVEMPKASSFTLEQWRAVWGGARLVPSACSAATCRIGAVLYAATPVTDCQGARLLVSPVSQPGCAGAVILDASRAARDGALAAWVSPARIRLITDRAWEGARPWVPNLSQP